MWAVEIGSLELLFCVLDVSELELESLLAWMALRILSVSLACSDLSCFIISFLSDSLSFAAFAFRSLNSWVKV